MTDLVRACAPEQVAYMTSRIPMKRCGSIEEVASVSAWIVSSECSFTTGFVFDLEGQPTEPVPTDSDGQQMSLSSSACKVIRKRDPGISFTLLLRGDAPF